MTNRAKAMGRTAIAVTVFSALFLLSGALQAAPIQTTHDTIPEPEPQPSPTPEPGSTLFNMTPILSTGLETLPQTDDQLLTEGSFSYSGSFLLPQTQSADFSYGGTAIAIDPNTGIFYAVGHDWYQMAAGLRIPTLVSSSDVGDLNTANVVYAPADLSGGLSNRMEEGDIKVGGLLPYGDKLLGTYYVFYDGDGDEQYSHFTANLDLTNQQGFYRVGDIGAGYVGGYMALIPQEWQAALGGLVLTGNSDLAIISRTSSGPAAFVFDPDDLGANPAPAIPLIYYPISNSQGPDDLNSLTAVLQGAFFAGDSLVFIRSIGDGVDANGNYIEWYGEADAGPGGAVDNYRSYKGYHSTHYSYQAQAYSAHDLVRVKNGELQPWEIKPYAAWKLGLPIEAGDASRGGVAYDPVHQMLYVSQVHAGNWGGPVIHALKVTVPPAGISPAPVPPSITSHPANVTVTEGQAATFSVTAAGTDPLSYQWQKNGVAIAGAASSSYTTVTTLADSGAQYRCVVTNSVGTAVSSAATLSVSALPPPPPDTSVWSWQNPKPLPPPTGAVVNVSTANQLLSAVNALQSGQTVLIAPGTYNLAGLTDALYIPQGITNWVVRGATGKRDDVIIRGGGMNGSVAFGFWVGNSTNGMIADLTVDGVREHCVILNPGAHGTLLHGLALVDSGDQFLKINPVGFGNGNSNVTLEYSIVRYRTHESGAGATPNYTNGISAHAVSNLTIRYNLFENILYQPGQGFAGPAVLVWNGSRDTLVEGNTFLNSSRGVALGLMDNTSGNDHQGGIVRNNMFYTSATLAGRADAPISINDSPNTQVLHNTVMTNGTFGAGIEYRFPSSTNIQVRNNLMDAGVWVRDGATGTQSGNVTNAAPSLFVNPSAGDLHLLASASAIDQATPVAGLTTDVDGLPRDVKPDTGADEYGNTGVVLPPPNQAPVVGAGADATVTLPATASLTGTVMDDGLPAGSVLAVSWSKLSGPGTVTFSNGSALSTTASFSASGNYVLRLTATDGDLSSSDDVAVTVNPAAVAPSITAHPANVTTAEGQSASFSVTAIGTAPLLYQWQRNGVVIAGATSASYSTTSAPADTGASYRCVVTNSAGTATSNAANLTVNALTVAPSIISHPMNATVTEGQSATFSVTAAGTAPLSYQWQRNGADIAGATSASYTTTAVLADNGASYRCVVTNVAGMATSNAATLTVQASLPMPVTPSTFATPHETIPNFAVTPTIWSAKNGAWSDPATWAQNRVPGGLDIVSIGHLVTYDSAATMVKTVGIRSGGKLAYRTNMNAALTVTNLLVMPAGELEIGTMAGPVPANVKAELIIANVPLDTAADPKKYGNGLIALGKITMHGAVKTPTAARLGTEPKKGESQLKLGAPAIGWQAGDKLVLPDTRQLDWDERDGNYVPQWEEATVAGVSADGLTITVTAPLKFDHLGARDDRGTLEFLPTVMNRSRNVVVRSESASGTRGHTMFANRAEVDVRFVNFGGLGRTRLSEINGDQDDRSPVQFRHLIGPTPAHASGYQYAFIGNSVSCPLDPMPFAWGINVNDSHYGLIKDNVLYNWAGSGLVTKTGSESFNVIEGNTAFRINGTGERIDYVGEAGTAFWFRGPNNYVRNNVAANFSGGVYTYGFSYMMQYAGTAKIPASRGADPSVQAQSKTIDLNDTPLLEFSGNEVYGASNNGMTVWWLGTFGGDLNSDMPRSVIKDFRLWHHHGWGFFLYETQNLTIDGVRIQGDTTLHPDNWATNGIWSGDYSQSGLIIRNADIRGMSAGIHLPGRAIGDIVIEDSTLRNRTNVYISMMHSVNGSEGLSPKSATMRNVRFEAPTGQPLAAVSLDYALEGPGSGGAPTNLIQKDEVFVYDYQGIAGDDFRVYYNEQASGFVVPETGSNNNPGRPLIGAPRGDRGMTNQQLVAKYPNGTTIEGQFYNVIAIAGAILPPEAVSRPGIQGGKVVPLNVQPVAPSITAHPANVSAQTGQTASFSVTATGTAPLLYQWQRDGADVAGATSDSYTTPVLQTSDSGSVYRCSVRNGQGTVMSNGATLTVTAPLPPPNQAPLVSARSDKTITLPAGVSLAGTASDDGLPAGSTLTVTWSKASGPGTVTFANGAALSTTASFSAAGSYVLRLTATDGALSTSDTASITVNAAPMAPSITSQPANVTVTEGQTASFSVTAAGTAPLSYQWQRNGSPIAGATSASYTTTSTLADNGALYRCVVTNIAGTATSNAAVLTVEPEVVVPPVPPAVRILSPEDGVLSHAKRMEIRYEISGDVPTGVRMRIQVDSRSPVTLRSDQLTGTYLVRNLLDGAHTVTLTLTDSTRRLLTNPEATDSVSFTVQLNKRPIVEAGLSQTVARGQVLALDGTVTDDGLPVGSTLRIRWSKMSGPLGGKVRFANNQVEDTTVTFTMAGSYVLRLRATDGALGANDTVTIEVTL